MKRRYSPKRKAETRAAVTNRDESRALTASPGRPELVKELRELILQAQSGIARTVDSTLSTLHWHIGRRIRADILKSERAEYGKEIVSALGRQLSADFGRGFDEKSLRHMVKFAEAFPEEAIVSALRRQLSWTHFKQIIYLDDPMKRDFYAEMCRVERWSTRTLQQKIGGMLFERVALSKKPDQLIRQELEALRTEDRLTPDLVFQDPYILDFLGLKDSYSEKDLEAALLREIERFILELGGRLRLCRASETHYLGRRRLLHGPAFLPPQVA